MAMPRLLLHLSALLVVSRAFRDAGSEGPRGRRLLVLVEDLSARSTHSVFLASLRARGFDLDLRLADDPKLALHRYGQYLYDGLVLLVPSSQHIRNQDMNNLNEKGCKLSNVQCCRKPMSSIIKLDRQLNLASMVSVTIVEYSVEIYEWSGTSWKPYVADDVQLQFYMMESIYFENYCK